jgi:Fic family protein
MAAKKQRKPTPKPKPSAKKARPAKATGGSKAARRAAAKKQPKAKPAAKPKVAKPKAAKPKAAKPKAAKPKAAPPKAKALAKKAKPAALTKPKQAVKSSRHVAQAKPKPKVAAAAPSRKPKPTPVSARRPTAAARPPAPPPRGRAAPPPPHSRKAAPVAVPPAKKSGKGAPAPPASRGRAVQPPARRSEPERRVPPPPPAPRLPVPPQRPSRARGAPPPRPAPRPPPMREPPRLVSLPLPLLPPPKRASVEERSASIEKRLAAQGEEFRRLYIDSLDMSWIYHDSALEGVVYTFEELRAALGGAPPPVSDSSLQPTYDDIRRHKEAIEFVRDFGEKKRLPVTVDVIKKIYLILHPQEGDIKTVKYRKDVPQHRLYFHEYTAPDKVAYKVRQVVDWLNDPETRKTRNGIRIAARAHFDLLRVYPFPTDSGKVARLFMNLLLMRTGLPPAIVHSTERQKYYEALKGSATTVLQMVQEAVENALSSVEKLLDEHETKKRAFVS